MYYYILDLGNKKIVKLKDKMEMIMASYGISGDFGKISPLASAYELAKRAISQHYKTIVAIGGSEIINQVTSAMIHSEAVLGIIPIDASSAIYELTGAVNLEKALEILRVRKVETIDVGKISDSKYFLTEAKIQNPKPIPTVLDFEDFKVGGSFQEIIIANGSRKKDSFQDGYFEVKIDHLKSKTERPWQIWRPSGLLRLFHKGDSSPSSFKAESVKIETEQQSNLLVDDEVVSKTPCYLRLLPLALKLIVSRRL